MPTTTTYKKYTSAEEEDNDDDGSGGAGAGRGGLKFEVRVKPWNTMAYLVLLLTLVMVAHPIFQSKLKIEEEKKKKDSKQ